MKTTKKIAAIALVVLFVLSMLPFAVSAATHKLTVKVGYAGYTVTVYQVATVNDTTGAYEITDNSAPDAVKAQVNAAVDSTAALFTELEKQTALGYPVSGTLTTTDSVQEKDFENLVPGIYYVKFTTLSSKNETNQNVIAVISDKDETFDLKTDGKVTEGEPYVHKKILEGTTEVDKTTTGNLAGDLVTFKLWAKRTGSASNKLSEYEIRDVMDAGLSAADVNIVSVKYDDGTDIADYEEKPAFTDKNAEGNDVNYDFAVSINSSVLDADAFYTHNFIVVTYTTKLSATAKNKTVYKNHDDLYFKNKSDQVSKVKGEDVEVVTYKPTLKKYSSDRTTLLQGAKFELYKSDKSTIIGYGESDANGEVNFTKTKNGTDPVYLKEGTYYAKEYEAPEKYNLNSSWIALQKDSTEYIYYGSAYNTPTKVPKTGEAGTLAITLTGLGLILASGAMFVVLMRKRSTK